MGWPTFKTTVPNYGWVIEFYEPTVAELKELQKAQETGDMEQTEVLISKLIKSWTVCDKQDNPLPVEGKSLEQVPPSVLKALTTGLLNPSADPKASSAS